MGGIVTKAKKDNEDEFLTFPNDDAYDEDAKDAADLIINKKSHLQTMIELSISCQNLPKLDFLSQTDAKIVVYKEEGGIFFRHDSTEVIADCPNPVFEKKIRVPYNFEKPQTLKFEVYDVDEFKDQDLLDKQELIGHVKTTLHQIVCSHNQTIALDIIANKTRNNRSKNCGLLKITGKEIDESANKISFHMEFNPYYSKNSFKLELAPVENINPPVLKMIDLKYHPRKEKGIDCTFTLIPSKTLTYDNSKIRIRVGERVKTKLILFGEAEAYLSDVLSNGATKVRVKRNGYEVGELKIKEVKRHARFTFLNYVDAGAEISLIIAMDFTKSNKEPTNPKSLHHVFSDQDNEYLQALKSIGGILQHYDSDNRIPLYGFGAKMPPYFNVVSNCFSLNGNYFDPEVAGLEEVIKVYKEALTKYKFHGPTVFSELLKMAIEYARAEGKDAENQKYFILLIMTDGVIDDFQRTKDEIVKASELPMSIIIIGVGDDDFTRMHELDGDDQAVMSSTGVEAARDIVQFVPFSKYKNNILLLAKKTLEEVPKQFLEYMRSNNIEPNKNLRKTRLQEKTQFHGSHDIVTFDKPKKIPTFLIKEKEKFIKELTKLEIDRRVISKILEEGIPSPDINLIIEMISYNKSALTNPEKLHNGMPSIEVDMLKEKLAASSLLKNLKKNPKIKVKHYASYDRGSEFEKLKSKEDTYRITHEILNTKDPIERYEKEEKSVYGKSFRKSQISGKTTNRTNFIFESNKESYDDINDYSEHLKNLTSDGKPFTVEEHACLRCQKRVLMPCGHAAFCSLCLTINTMEMCGICKQKINYHTISKNK